MSTIIPEPTTPIERAQLQEVANMLPRDAAGKMYAFGSMVRRVLWELDARETEVKTLRKALDAEEIAAQHFAKCSYEDTGCETAREDDEPPFYCPRYLKLSRKAAERRFQALLTPPESQQPAEAIPVAYSEYRLDGSLLLGGDGIADLVEIGDIREIMAHYFQLHRQRYAGQELSNGQ